MLILLNKRYDDVGLRFLHVVGRVFAFGAFICIGHVLVNVSYDHTVSSLYLAPVVHRPNIDIREALWRGQEVLLGLPDDLDFLVWIGLVIGGALIATQVSTNLTLLIKGYVTLTFYLWSKVQILTFHGRTRARRYIYWLLLVAKTLQSKGLSREASVLYGASFHSGVPVLRIDHTRVLHVTNFTVWLPLV